MHVQINSKNDDGIIIAPDHIDTNTNSKPSFAYIDPFNYFIDPFTCYTNDCNVYKYFADAENDGFSECYADITAAIAVNVAVNSDDEPMNVDSVGVDAESEQSDDELDIRDIDIHMLNLNTSIKSYEYWRPWSKLELRWFKFMKLIHLMIFSTTKIQNVDTQFLSFLLQL